MSHFMQRKIQIKDEILKMLDSNISLDLDLTAAEFSLQTGFSENTIRKIIKQMQKLNYIKVEGLLITRPDNENAGGASI